MIYSDDDDGSSHFVQISGLSPMVPPPRQQDVPTIRVIAPATLAEGYSFDVLVDNEAYTVEVPKGGVKEGQEFEVLYEPHIFGANARRRQYQDEEQTSSPIKEYDEEDQTRIQEQSTMPVQTMSEDHDDDKADDDKKSGQAIWYDEVTGAPIGRWRTKLCSCCDVLTQSTFWMGLCCAPILIAQLITRLGLTWNGQSGASDEEKSLSFNRLVLGTMLALAVWKIPLVGDLVLLMFYLFIVVHIGAQVRRYMRQKYKIPPTLPTRCGNRMEDGCCMLFCGCCSAIQMARHTHDDKEYPGHGCTTTGLGLEAPSIV